MGVRCGESPSKTLSIERLRGIVTSIHFPNPYMVMARIELDEVLRLCLRRTQLAVGPTGFLPELDAIDTADARRLSRRQSTVTVPDFHECLFRFKNKGIPVAK